MEEETKKNNSNVIWYVIGFVIGLVLITFLRQRRLKEKVSSKQEDTRVNFHNGLNRRQEKILNEIRKKRIISPTELYAFVPNVSPRTLRRDMDVLAKSGFVMQEGTTKSTTYRYAEKQ